MVSRFFCMGPSGHDHQGVILRSVVLGVLLAAGACRTGCAAEVSWLEDFVLGPDRQKALQLLVPATPEHFYFHCLWLQQHEQWDECQRQLQLWIDKHGRSSETQEIEHRLHLLTFAQDPQKTWEYLAQVLALQFDHQREHADQAPDLPTTLDPALIERQRFLRDAWDQHQGVEAFQETAWPWLIQQPLEPQQRRELLQRLKRPDYPGLVTLIAADLRERSTASFGSLPIHEQLMIDQLETLAKDFPELLRSQQFVQAYIRKLRPRRELPLEQLPEERARYLQQLSQLIQRLEPVHNNLMAHVTYHQLAHDLTQNHFDKQRFLRYLQLPKQTVYVRPEWLQRQAAGQALVDLHDAAISQVTGLPAIDNDEPLVRTFLDHFLAEAESGREFAPYIEKDYLQQIFAESKLVRNLGDAQRWYELLTPGQLEALRNRIDLEFVPHRPVRFGRQETVTLEVDIKHVPSLIVKIYEINTVNLYRRGGRLVGPDLQLDGLVPNSEQQFQYQDSPFHKVRRSFSFPELQRPGIYVIDFIGNGKSSRAVIRKGDLQISSTLTDQGHLVRVFDEQQHPVHNASIWLSGHVFTADPQGIITIPFTHQPSDTQVVVRDGDLAVLRPFSHARESFELQAGMFIDPESLQAGSNAQVMIRPQLLLHGYPTTISHLEQAKLTIRSVDQEGIATSQEIVGLQLHNDLESLVSFRVPPQLASLTLTLQGQVQRTTDPKPETLSVETTIDVNGIDGTDQYGMFFLQRNGTQYEVTLRGKSGETLPQRAVQVELHHRDFIEPARATLKTNDQGILQLGDLPDIASVHVQAPHAAERTWQLPVDQRQYLPQLTVPAGEIVQLPSLARNSQERDVPVLVEVRNGQWVRDFSDHVESDPHHWTIAKLPPGEYEFTLHTQQIHVRIDVLEGPHDETTVRDRYRMVQRTPWKTAAIREVRTDAENLQIELQGATPQTRVHLLATHFTGDSNLFSALQRPVANPAPSWRTWEANQFAIGRNIGDEYQYILDRKLARKFPGIMLRRPELLLQPWEIRQSVSAKLEAKLGESFDAAPAPAEPSLDSLVRLHQERAPHANAENFEFLPGTSLLAANLRPSGDGKIVIPLAKLGNTHHLQVVVVDGPQVESRQVTLRGHAWQSEDRRLAHGFAPELHLLRKQQATLLQAGETLTLRDASHGRFRIYDTLSSAFNLLTTLQSDERLSEFGFLTVWPTLDEETKLAKYNTYGCHELNLFLFRRDRPFFDRVVKPHLAQKLHKTFLDDWLLERDLQGYLEPWRFERLNVVERILLGTRLPAERDLVRQLVRDQVQSQPRDPSRWDHLFRTALAGQRLAARQQSLEYRADAEGTVILDAFAAPAAPASNGAMGGMAGGMGVEAESMRDNLEQQADRMKSWHMLGRGTARRERSRFFQPLDSTQEWAETHYDRVQLSDLNATLIPVDAAWQAWAEASWQQPLLPTSWLYGHDNRNDTLLTLALLDLPFEAAPPAIETTDQGVVIRAASPLMVYHEAFEASDHSVTDSPVLVNQRYFDPAARSEMVDGQPRDKYLNANDYVIHHVYGCQVNVSNAASTPQTVYVLLQIPSGAIPVQGGRTAQVTAVTLAPFAAQKLEYFFYFPQAGQFAHYPVHVFADDKVLAFASPTQLEVANRSQPEDPTSWNYVSQFASTEQLLAFLRERNLEGLDLSKIAFRLRDGQIFQQVTDTLRKRHRFDPELWSYALFHRATREAQEFLSQQTEFVTACGGWLKSPLLQIDARLRADYEHLEYHPLVNSRAHRLGNRWQVANPQVHGQYERLLKMLCYQTTLTSEDWLELTYYLLLQDRVDEALQAWKKVVKADIAAQLQYDYLDAYLACLQENRPQAAEIAQKYTDYPVVRWRDAFRAMEAMLAEVAGDEPRVVDADNRGERLDQLANLSPSFDVRYQEGHVELDYAHVDRVQVNYYRMDLELLFSRNPFLQTVSGDFATIRPNHQQEVILDPQQRSVRLKLPASLQHSNVLIEVEGAGQVRTLPIYAHRMNVQVFENYGQIRILAEDSGSPLTKVYVKVFARNQDGSVAFYKDGYTDLRGRFDFATLSTNQLTNVQRFSLLVISEEHGATVREANPPKP